MPGESAVLLTIQEGDVLFVDELMIKTDIEEILYPAIIDIDIMIERCECSSIRVRDLPQFTLASDYKAGNAHRTFALY